MFHKKMTLTVKKCIQQYLFLMNLLIFFSDLYYCPFPTCNFRGESRGQYMPHLASHSEGELYLFVLNKI